jgi:N-acyl-L-homoserine lactone synthetase
MTTEMLFQPPLVLDSNNGNADKNYPISIRVCASASQQSDIKRLRYRAFRDGGYIPENASEQFVDRYDRLPSTYAIGAYHAEDCVGTLRLAFGERDRQLQTMPCEEVFPKEVASLDPDRCSTMVEFSRMAVEPSLGNWSFRTTLYASLVRAGLILSTAARTDIVLIAVHPRVSRFYQVMCGFEIIGHSKSYAEIAEETDLLALRFGEAERRRRRSNAFFGISPHEVEAATRILAAFRQRRAA